MSDLQIADILLEMRPGEEWAINGDDYSSLQWLSETPKPSKKEIDAFKPKAQIAIALARVRQERNRLLQESDWTQLPNAPVDVEKWAVYRQQLRDFPESCDPLVPTWPSPPE